MAVVEATCTVVIIILATITVGLIRAQKFLNRAMVLILSNLVFFNKRWCLEYLVQEILSLKSVIASGGDYKI